MRKKATPTIEARKEGTLTVWAVVYRRKVMGKFFDRKNAINLCNELIQWSS